MSKVFEIAFCSAAASYVRLFLEQVMYSILPCFFQCVKCGSQMEANFIAAEVTELVTSPLQKTMKVLISL